MNAAHSATLLNVVATRTDDRSETLIRVVSVLFVTGLTAAAAQISFQLPFTQVPFTFQPMVVLIGGLVLGSRLGFTSQVLYLMAGIAGLPVFAASAALPPGILRLFGPTGGYLMSYPVAAFVVGVLAERGFAKRYVTSVMAMLVGLAIIYAAGTLWLAYFARLASASAAVGLSAALASGVYPFVLADLVKLAAAAGITPGLWRLIGTRGPRT
jgi:biotin transport system substrate-specific component